MWDRRPVSTKKIMATVPRDIVLAVRRGDVNVVTAWLDAAPRNVNVLTTVF